jgi:hypothetical protein
MKDFVKFGNIMFHKSLVTYNQALAAEPTLTRADYNDRISGISKEKKIQVIQIVKKKDLADVVEKPNVKLIKPKKRK